MSDWIDRVLAAEATKAQSASEYSHLILFLLLLLQLLLFSVF